MSTRDALLELLESDKGRYFSGEDIAGQLHVSRASVWKAVKALQGEGYPIDGVSNKGYCLSVQADILSPQGMKKYLKPSCRKLELEVLPVITSTNAYLRERAVAGERREYVVAANEQTAGVGRRNGRKFFSPRDTGIYMSLLLTPKDCSPQQALRFTTMAAVAVCEAVEAVSEKKAQIKWVNDVFVENKKICGILTEASFSMENGKLDYAVLGVGINLYPPKGGFPEEIESIAGTIFAEPQNDGKNRLAAEFLNRFMECYENPERTDYVEAYRSHSLVIGRQVQVIGPESERAALALGIDDDCRLLVQYEDGSRESLYSGEISVKL